MQKFMIVGIITSFFVLSSCVENPFFGQNDKPQLKLEVSGNVTMADESDNSIIFVWIEGLDMSTRANSEGDFTLKLDYPESLPGGAKAWNGVFKIYYYVANYGYEVSEVLISDGEFVFDRYDLTKEGRVRDNISLSKIVKIETTLWPDKPVKDISNNIFSADEQKVRVTINIQRLTSTPVTFSSYMGSTGIGSFFMKRVDTTANISWENFDKKAIFTTNVDLASSVFSEIEIPLRGIKPGVYIAIPFILIHQTGLPPELWEAINMHATSFTAHFFNIPMTFDATNLVVLKA